MALRQDVLVLINEIGLRDVIPVPSDSTETRKRKRSSFEQEIKVGFSNFAAPIF